PCMLHCTRNRTPISILWRAATAAASFRPRCATTIAPCPSSSWARTDDGDAYFATQVPPWLHAGLRWQQRGGQDHAHWQSAGLSRGTRAERGGHPRAGWDTRG